MSIPRKFLARDTVIVAKELLGKKLVRKIGNKTISGIITETEAYRQSDDAASHAFMGITPRNQAMFGEVGCAYVYFTYGMHHCMNVVCGKEDQGVAVLLRAIKPTQGLKQMFSNRKKAKSEGQLCSGPAKLTQALEINRSLNGVDMRKSKQLFIELIRPNFVEDTEVQRSARIGVAYADDWANRKLRFVLKGYKGVSKE